MVILVSALNARFFRDRADPEYLASLDHITMRLGRGAAYVLLTYFGFKLVTVAHENNWAYLNTAYGYWFLIESLGLVLFPCFLFAYATRRDRMPLVRLAALITIIGIIANRLTVSVFAYNWNLPDREWLHWKELLIVIAVITMEVVVYRWIVNRMPVLTVEEGGGETTLEPQAQPVSS